MNEVKKPRIVPAEVWNGRAVACPNCGVGRGGPRGVHWQTFTVWCLGCGWSRNRIAR